MTRVENKPHRLPISPEIPTVAAGLTDYAHQKLSQVLITAHGCPLVFQGDADYYHRGKSFEQHAVTVREATVQVFDASNIRLFEDPDDRLLIEVMRGNLSEMGQVGDWFYAHRYSMGGTNAWLDRDAEKWLRSAVLSRAFPGPTIQIFNHEHYSVKVCFSGHKLASENLCQTFKPGCELDEEYVRNFNQGIRLCLGILDVPKDQFDIKHLLAGMSLSFGTRPEVPRAFIDQYELAPHFALEVPLKEEGK